MSGLCSESDDEVSHFTFEQIGIIHSPWKEKFAVPRQPGLVKDGCGQLHLTKPYNHADAVRGLEGFSHIWLIFVFHQTMENGWRPTVRPPRLGGNQRTGVFSTRSTFRPNPVGLSLVELKEIHCENGRVVLDLGSLDLLDGTPVIDIKPYLPFAEALPAAKAGFAQHAPDADMPVVFSDQALQQISGQTQYPRLRKFITQVLEQDPRPAYRRGAEPERIYAVRILDYTLRWRITDQGTEVLSVDPC